MIAYLLIFGGCLLGGAVFAGFETGMISIRRARLDHAVKNGSRTAAEIAALLQKPAIMLGTVLLGTNLCYSFAAVYFDELIQLLGVSEPVTLAAPPVLAVFILVFGEILPKGWFRQHPLRRCAIFVYPIWLFQRLFFPFVMGIGWISHAFSRLLSSDVSSSAHGQTAVMREEFRLLLLESEETGRIDSEARLLLDNALDFHDIRIGDIMTPGEQVQTIEINMTLADAVQLAEKTGFYRFPVADPAQNGRWIGILSTYDAIFRVDPEKWAETPVFQYLRPAISLSAADRIDLVLPRLRAARAQIAFVTDQQDNQSGVVSARDVITPLFGQLPV